MAAAIGTDSARRVRHGLRCAALLAVLPAAAAGAQMLSIPLGGPPREHPSPNAALLGAPADVAAAIAAKGRPAAMRELDAVNHPAEVLAFLGLSRGVRVVVAEREPGYFGTIIGAAAGPGSRVTEIVAPAAMADPATRAMLSDDISLAPALSLRTASLATVRLPPASVDFALLHLAGVAAPGVARAAIAATLFAALRPDGIAGVVDEAPGDGCGAAAGGAAAVRADFTRAGFVVDSSGTLRSGATPGETPDAACAVRRFIVRFRKPE